MSASKVPHVIYQNTSFFCKELLVIIEFFEKCNKCINGRTDSNRRTVIHWCLKSSTIIISFHRNHILNFTKYEPIKSKFVLVPSRSSKYWISVIWIFIEWVTFAAATCVIFWRKYVAYWLTIWSGKIFWL